MNAVLLSRVEGHRVAAHLDDLAGDLREQVEKLIDKGRERAGTLAGCRGSR